jgi:hypothetical protein
MLKNELHINDAKSLAKLVVLLSRLRLITTEQADKLINMLTVLVFNYDLARHKSDSKNTKIEDF